MWGVSEAELGRQKGSVGTNRTLKTHPAPLRACVVLSTPLRTTVPPQRRRMQQRVQTILPPALHSSYVSQTLLRHLCTVFGRVSVEVRSSRMSSGLWIGMSDLQLILDSLLLKSLQICARLPCDEPCTKELECGHPCPSSELLAFSVFGDLVEPGA
jgi:hypothetical protein